MATIELPRWTKPWTAWTVWMAVWSFIFQSAVQKESVLSEINASGAFLFLSLGVAVAIYKLNGHFEVVKFK